jgi:hypothetical protein
MDIDDICKYIGYIVAGILVFYLALKSIRFQYKCVEGFVKKTPAEGFVIKQTPTEKQTSVTSA